MTSQRTGRAMMGSQQASWRASWGRPPSRPWRRRRRRACRRTSGACSAWPSARSAWSSRTWARRSGSCAARPAQVRACSPQASAHSLFHQLCFHRSNDLLSTADLRSLLLEGVRPLNSALEIDLDFERAVRPPPQPTEEVTASIEDLIRKRIADHQFDDVPRIAPPAPEKRRKTLDLSDQKSEKVGAFLPLAQEFRAGRPPLRSPEDTIELRSSGT